MNLPASPARTGGEHRPLGGGDVGELIREGRGWPS
jgi:hypothetical protein